MNAVAAETNTNTNTNTASVDPCRFSINGDGTVTDLRTGLTWTQDDVTENRVNHEAAAKACADCRVGGFDDWRLPTVEELFLLADLSRHSPAIDTEAFPSCTGGWYWTSTLDAESPSNYAWFVYFYNGSSSYGYRDNNGRVRAVRRASGQ